MTTFFTSDTHFGHARILELSERPFSDISHHNEMLVHNWNALVRPDDTVYHLGDVALGPIEESLGYIQRLNGRKILVVGNHDRMFPPMQKGANKDAKILDWKSRYRDAGFDEIYTNHRILLGGYHFNLSHFPYDGDSHDGDRFTEYRLQDLGLPLLHGHTHSSEKFSKSKAGTPMVHVGMDSWDYAPVSFQAVIDVLDQNINL